MTRGREDSNASTIADFCIFSRDAALRGVRLPGVLKDIGSSKSKCLRGDIDLALVDVALIMIASMSVFIVILLEVKVLEDTSCAGNEARRASVDATPGFCTMSSITFTSVAEPVKVGGIIGTGVGPRSIAGSKAGGASFDTASGFTSKSGASALTFGWTDSR